MKLYTAKKETQSASAVVLDDMLLTKELPTSAGSHMLDGFVCLFDASVVEKLTACGYEIGGKASVGEFSIDFLGESSYYGSVTDEKGNLSSATAQILKNGECAAAICLDVNGAPRRAAALADLVYLKPTYGTVSRFGTVPAVCSGECVSVMAKDVSALIPAWKSIVGHDDKDGTSLPEGDCARALESAPIQKIAILTPFLSEADDAVKARVAAMKDALCAMGIAVSEKEDSLLLQANQAWNVLMCAELCNNVSRYDGIKYGYRTPNYKTIDELYTGSRTEAFGELLKTAVLYGSDALSTDNYMKVYDKALRVRRVMVEHFAALFEEYDALLMPACAHASYAPSDVSLTLAFDENVYTAPASITGLPAMVFGGVQLVGKALSDGALVALAKAYEEGRKE